LQLQIIFDDDTREYYLYKDGMPVEKFKTKRGLCKGILSVLNEYP
jgi:hypothetical protein